MAGKINKGPYCTAHEVGPNARPCPIHTKGPCPQRSVMKNCYLKDFGDGRFFISGLPLPRDADGVTRNIDFVDCDLHPASVGVFENCFINGESIPDGPGCLWDYENGAADESLQDSIENRPLKEEMVEQYVDVIKKGEWAKTTTRTIKELAVEVLQVQDACNLSGVVHSWSRAITELRSLSPGASTETINTHPINVLWASKCRDLAFGKEDICAETVEQYRHAYVTCERLAKGE